MPERPIYLLNRDEPSPEELRDSEDTLLFLHEGSYTFKKSHEEIKLDLINHDVELYFIITEDEIQEKYKTSSYDEYSVVESPDGKLYRYHELSVCWLKGGFMALPDARSEKLEVYVDTDYIPCKEIEDIVVVKKGTIDEKEIALQGLERTHFKYPEYIIMKENKVLIKSWIREYDAYEEVKGDIKDIVERMKYDTFLL